MPDNHNRVPDIDGVLIQWGDRLFYPSNRIVKSMPAPKLNAIAASQRAAAIRERITATVVRRAPQVIHGRLNHALHERSRARTRPRASCSTRANKPHCR